MNSKPILFVDFDGTICFDRYWRSLPAEQFEKIQKLLFQGNNGFVDEWMKGKLSSEDINIIAAKELGIAEQELWRLFVKDCESMKVENNILERISSLRDKYATILITGNMDSFTKFTVPALKLESYFDYISNSFYEGKYKTDNGGELFVEYANKLIVSIGDCIVIDDSPKVCSIFETLGGKAFQITPDRDIMSYLGQLG